MDPKMRVIRTRNSLKRSCQYSQAQLQNAILSQQPAIKWHTGKHTIKGGSNIRARQQTFYHVPRSGGLCLIDL